MARERQTTWTGEARERDLSGFGYVYDEAELAPDHVVGSLAWQLTETYRPMVEDVRDGTFQPIYDIPMSEGGFEVGQLIEDQVLLFGGETVVIADQAGQTGQFGALEEDFDEFGAGGGVGGGQGLGDGAVGQIAGRFGKKRENIACGLQTTAFPRRINNIGGADGSPIRPISVIGMAWRAASNRWSFKNYSFFSRFTNLGRENAPTID